MRNYRSMNRTRTSRYFGRVSDPNLSGGGGGLPDLSAYDRVLALSPAGYSSSQATLTPPSDGGAIERWFADEDSEINQEWEYFSGAGSPMLYDEGEDAAKMRAVGTFYACHQGDYFTSAPLNLTPPYTLYFVMKASATPASEKKWWRSSLSGAGSDYYLRADGKLRIINAVSTIALPEGWNVVTIESEATAGGGMWFGDTDVQPATAQSFPELDNPGIFGPDDSTLCPLLFKSITFMDAAVNMDYIADLRTYYGTN